MYTYMYLSRSQYDTKVEYGLVFPRCAETTQWSEELQVKMVQTSNWSTSWAEVFHVGCRLLSNGRCACFEMFSTKLDHSIHLVQRILQKHRDQVHFTTSVASDVEQRTSGPVVLWEDRVFVPCRLVTPVGKSSANRWVDQRFLIHHDWGFP